MLLVFALLLLYLSYTYMAITIYSQALLESIQTLQKQSFRWPFLTWLLVTSVYLLCDIMKLRYTRGSNYRLLTHFHRTFCFLFKTRS